MCSHFKGINFYILKNPYIGRRPGPRPDAPSGRGAFLDAVIRNLLLLRRTRISTRRQRRVTECKHLNQATHEFREIENKF